MTRRFRPAPCRAGACRLVAALVAAALAFSAAAETVTVITSFPKELTAAYKKAFEAKYPGRQARDPEQEHRRRHRLRARAAGGQPARGVLGLGAGRLRGARRRRSCCRRSTRGNPAIPAKIGNYPINDPRGLLLGPGARRLRHHVEHALPRGQQAARAEGMGRSRQAGLLRPRRDLEPVALGHHAPHRRDHPAGRRLGRRAGRRCCDLRQLRGDHRAQLRRARRRVQRPVRHRPGDRLLRPRGEELRACRSSSSIRP